MLQLLYSSISTEPISLDIIENICAIFRRNNRRNEITGVLIADAGRFFQALEGPKVTVEDTFMRMVVDPRHHSPQILSRRLITRREFGEWEMRLFESLNDCPDMLEAYRHALDRGRETARNTFEEFMLSRKE